MNHVRRRMMGWQAETPHDKTTILWDDKIKWDRKSDKNIVWTTAIHAHSLEEFKW